MQQKAELEIIYDQHWKMTVKLRKKKQLSFIELKAKLMADQINIGNVNILDAHVVIQNWRKCVEDPDYENDNGDHDYIENALSKLVLLNGHMCITYQEFDLRR